MLAGGLDGCTAPPHLPLAFPCIRGSMLPFEISLLNCWTVSLESPVGVRNGHLASEWAVEIDIAVYLLLVDHGCVGFYISVSYPGKKHGFLKDK